LNHKTTDDLLPVTVPPLAFDVDARLQAIDHASLNRYRLSRLRGELERLDYMGAVLSDPMNIHYATASRNMPIWTMHAPGRYAFVATDGPVVLFEFSACRNAMPRLEIVDEVRTGISTFYLFAGPRSNERATEWTQQISDLVNQYGRRNRRLAIDRCEPWLARQLLASCIELFDAQEPLEQARRIKSPEEIACLQLAMDVCDLGVSRMREALHAGVTENQLWSVFHSTNIAHGGDFIECKLFASGPRTFPWFHECSNRTIEAGDLIAFDTDMIGPGGYLADISRSYLCPGRKPTANQGNLHALAREQVFHNTRLIEPGLSFREFAEKSWRIPQRFYPNRYMVLVHGVGLTDEFPAVLCDGEQQQSGYDGIFEENMVVSVESYLGDADGGEGVKLEEQVLITQKGAVAFSRNPLETSLEIK